MSDEMLGDDFKLYYDTAASFDSPTWAEQKSLGGITFDTGNTQVEIPKRIPHKTYKKGRADWTLGFDGNYDKSNAFHMAVRDAINDGEKIHIAVADGDIEEDADYWHAWWFLKGPLGAELDTNANIQVEGKVHHDTGDDDAEMPAFVPAGT